jgi:regulator of sigma E protease
VGDEVYGIRIWTHAKGDTGELDWSPWGWFGEDEDAARDKPQAWWAYNFRAIQADHTTRIGVRALRDGKSVEYDVDLNDLLTDWPMEDRGFHAEQDTMILQADSPLQALGMGLKRTYRTIVGTYKSLAGMALNPKRLPIAKNLRGPVAIAQMAYDVAGIDFATFLVFLGAINISLAVVNFLPIPILDGGHMVFLIYEKIRGKPASDQVRLGLTYAGLALLLALMVFVIYLDIGRILKK